jgi:hypothetical protein
MGIILLGVVGSVGEPAAFVNGWEVGGRNEKERANYEKWPSLNPEGNVMSK